MAKHIGQVNKFQCTECGIKARRQELIVTNRVSNKRNGIRCPNCGEYKFKREVKRVRQEDYQIDLRPIAGILNLRYVGFGEIVCPEVIIQEERWEPSPITIPNVANVDTDWGMSHYEFLASGLDTIGCTRPWKMVGLDIISGGSTLCFPFFMSNRLWIDGNEVNHEQYYEKSRSSWDIYL